MTPSKKELTIIKKVLNGIGRIVRARLLKDGAEVSGFAILLFHRDYKQVHLIHSGLCEKGLARTLETISKETDRGLDLPPLHTMN